MKLIKNNDNIKFILYVLILIAPLSFIFSYGKYRCTHKSYKDPLENEILYKLDGWSATHFIWYLIVGYFFPKTFVTTTIVGIGWELFEQYYGKERPGWLGSYGDCTNLATNNVSGNWWYGKWTDIICNTTGFLIGQYMKLGKITFKNQEYLRHLVWFLFLIIFSKYIYNVVHN